MGAGGTGGSCPGGTGGRPGTCTVGGAMGIGGSCPGGNCPSGIGTGGRGAGGMGTGGRGGTGGVAPAGGIGGTGECRPWYGPPAGPPFGPRYVPPPKPPGLPGACPAPPGPPGIGPFTGGGPYRDTSVGRRSAGRLSAGGLAGGLPSSSGVLLSADESAPMGRRAGRSDACDITGPFHESTRYPARPGRGTQALGTWARRQDTRRWPVRTGQRQYPVTRYMKPL